MCNCIEEANKALAAAHTIIDTKMAVTFGSKEAHFKQVMYVPTRSTKRGKKARIVPVNFCPLCGEDQRAKPTAKVERTARPGHGNASGKRARVRAARSSSVND